MMHVFWLLAEQFIYLDTVPTPQNIVVKIPVVHVRSIFVPHLICSFAVITSWPDFHTIHFSLNYILSSRLLRGIEWRRL